MDARPTITKEVSTPSERTEASLRIWRALALAAAALIAAMAFGAYNQPELLLNYIGLRYCG
jgi:hypothetical protein